MMQERAKFWLAEDFDNMELLHARYITHRFVPHTHDGYAIGIVEYGAEEFLYRRKDWVAPEGTIVIVNPGEIHTGQATSEEGWIYRMFYPSVNVVCKAIQSLGLDSDQMPLFSETIMHDQQLIKQMRDLHQTLEYSSDALERETKWVETMTELVSRHADIAPQSSYRSHSSKRLESARDYIHTHYEESISLDDLAAISNLSPYHFSRSFKDAFGLPPHTYVTKVRVEQAKSLLKQRIPLAQVATATGFVDQSHFTRRFKRIVGVPPGSYLTA